MLIYQIFSMLLAIVLHFHLIKAEYPFCFSFTWIGPYPLKTNIVHEHCNRRLASYNDIPCQMPLIATKNDIIPDTYAIWQNDTRYKYACTMEPGWSCVKYSYIFKNAIQNITYMCAKVNATNGCYRQMQYSGMEVEACACTSQVGLMPCNQGAQIYVMPHQLYVILSFVVVILINYKVT